MVGASYALAKLPACTRAGDGTFTAEQLAMLNGLADVILPRDDQPGGADLGAATYIERLIHAFDQTPALPAAIYASGPYSGRQPFPDPTTGVASTMFPENDFATWVELDRVLDAAWRITVQGSTAVGGAPNDAILGPVVGIKDQLVAGFDAAIAASKTSVFDMSADQFQVAFDNSDPAFQQLMLDLVTQAAFCAPEYGGNPGGSGWTMVHFEGDSLPLGYSAWNGTSHVERADSPLTTANAGDPEPLTDDVNQVLSLVAAFLGGQAF
jgi:hypothetical protein